MDRLGAVGPARRLTFNSNDEIPCEGAVQPLSVDRVEGILLALEPIAVQVCDADVVDPLALDHGAPVRQIVRGCWSEVPEHEPDHLFDRIAGEVALGAEGRLR